MIKENRSSLAAPDSEPASKWEAASFCGSKRMYNCNPLVSFGEVFASKRKSRTNIKIAVYHCSHHSVQYGLACSGRMLQQLEALVCLGQTLRIVVYLFESRGIRLLDLSILLIFLLFKQTLSH